MSYTPISIFNFHEPTQSANTFYESSQLRLKLNHYPRVVNSAYQFQKCMRCKTLPWKPLWLLITTYSLITFLTSLLFFLKDKLTLKNDTHTFPPWDTAVVLLNLSFLSILRYTVALGALKANICWGIKIYKHQKENHRAPTFISRKPNSKFLNDCVIFLIH